MTRWTLVRRNLTRRKLRTVLTIFAVMTAFLLFGLLKSLERTLDAGSDLAAADRLVVINKINFTQPLPISYIDRIRQVEGVSDVTWADWVGAYFRDPKQVFVAFAVDPESYLRIYPEFRIDEQARKRWMADRQGVLVGRKLAEMYGWKVGERIPIRSQIWINGESGDKSWEVNIDGILDTDDPRRDTRFMLMHWKYLDEARTFRRNTFGWAVLRTKGPEYNEKVARTIDAMFENSSHATRTDTEAAFAKAFIDQLGNVGLIITSVVGAAMFTILLVAGTTMMLAVRERTREIAVMKTIGFSAGGVFAMVLAEAAMIAFLGGFGGLLVALGILEAAGQALAQYLPHLSMGAETWALGFGLMLALTLATGLPPAWNAMRLSIVAGLGWRS